MNVSRTITDTRSRPAVRVVALAVCLCAVAGCRFFGGSHRTETLPPAADYLTESVQFAPPEPESPPESHIVPVGAEFPTTSDFELGPPTLRNPHEGATRSVDVEDVVRIALENTSIVRDDSQFLSTANTLLANPSLVPSAYDADIQATGGAYGIGGIDAAKSGLDPYFLAGSSFGRNNLVQNNRFLSGGLVPGSILEDETGSLTSRVEQRLEQGTFLSLSHNLGYSANNQPNRFFPSAYSGLVRAEVRQPLLAGYGREFTSIAGPIGRSPSAVQPVDRGLVIARINRNLSATDFETNVQNLLRGVKAAYWDLVLAYAVHADQVAARDDAEALWERVKTRRDAGLEGANLADEAQARERLYQWQSTVDNALSDLYEAEARLRRLIGLPPERDELLEPVDTLATAPLHPDWPTSLAEALTLRLELRKQKSTIRSLTLQLQAARSLKKPRLDVVTGANLNGFGDDLLGGGGIESAYGSLFGFGQTGWDVGLEFSMPLGGNRAAGAMIRNLQLRLTKARSALAAQEDEVGHEVAHAFRELERWWSTIESRTLRLEAAGERTAAVNADYEAGRTDLDNLLRARTGESLARVELAQARARYRKAICDLHYRQGTILNDASVRIADESPAHDPADDR